MESVYIEIHISNVFEKKKTTDDWAALDPHFCVKSR